MTKPKIESIGAGIQKLLEVLGNYGNADGITAQRDNLQDVKFEE